MKENPTGRQGQAIPLWTAESPETMQITANYISPGRIVCITVHFLKTIRHLWKRDSGTLTSTVMKGSIQPSKDTHLGRENGRRKKRLRRDLENCAGKGRRTDGDKFYADRDKEIARPPESLFAMARGFLVSFDHFKYPPRGQDILSKLTSVRLCDEASSDATRSLDAVKVDT